MGCAKDSGREGNKNSRVASHTNLDCGHIHRLLPNGIRDTQESESQFPPRSTNWVNGLGVVLSFITFPTSYTCCWGETSNASELER